MAEASTMPLVSQTPADRDAVAARRVELGDTRRRRGVDADRAYRALDQVEPPDGAVAALGGHDGAALGRVARV
jgi:hypothetical protein